MQDVSLHTLMFSKANDTFTDALCIQHTDIKITKEYTLTVVEPEDLTSFIQQPPLNMNLSQFHPLPPHIVSYDLPYRGLSLQQCQVQDKSVYMELLTFYTTRQHNRPNNLFSSLSSCLFSATKWNFRHLFLFLLIMFIASSHFTKTQTLVIHSFSVLSSHSKYLKTSLIHTVWHESQTSICRKLLYTVTQPYVFT